MYTHTYIQTHTYTYTYISPGIIFKTKALFDESFQINIIIFTNLCKYKVTMTFKCQSLYFIPRLFRK